jgi:long-chain fatty acid transport protein
LILIPKHAVVLARIAGIACALLAWESTTCAQGLVLPAIGPVNQSMGGASVAAPLDSIGALYWNPATLSGLSQSEMEFGVQLLYTRTTLSSSLGANSVGPGLPATSLSGSTSSDTGIYPLPSFGLSYRPTDSPITLGLGVFTTGGYGVNYPGVSTNPILSPRPPEGFGVGAIYSELEILELAPAVSYQVTDNLSVGLGPTIVAEKLSVNPGIFATPFVGNGSITYPTATNAPFYWGLGFQAGVYYTLTSDWHFGGSFRSTEWVQTIRFNSQDPAGNAEELHFKLDYPMITSIGVSYTGIDKLLLATDVRYVDYHNTSGFRSTGFDAAGAVTGLGWRSVVAVAAGAQYRLSDSVSVRLGYSFNPDPIPDSASFFNAASPALYEHIVFLGGTYKVTTCFSIMAAYYHAFHNSITGPYETASGPIAASAVTNSAEIDALTLGFSVAF